MPDDKFEKDLATYEAVDATRALITKYESIYPNLKFHLIGQTTVNVTFNELSNGTAGFGSQLCLR